MQEENTWQDPAHEDDHAKILSFVTHMGAIALQPQGECGRKISKKPLPCTRHVLYGQGTYFFPPTTDVRW